MQILSRPAGKWVGGQKRVEGKWSSPVAQDREGELISTKQKIVRCSWGCESSRRASRDVPKPRLLPNGIGCEQPS